MESQTIESWIIKTTEIPQIDEINEWLSNNKYLLNTNKTEYDIIEKYVCEIALFHIKEKNIEYDPLLSTHYIEFSLLNEERFIIDYEKPKKKYPLFSTITYLSDEYNPLIFTNTDMEAYKYKELKDEETILCSIPQKNTHILFDSSKYYGFLYGDKPRPLCLKINLWNIKPQNTTIYSPTSTNTTRTILHENNLRLVFEKQNDNICQEKLINNKNILESLLYNTEVEQVDKITTLVNKYRNPTESQEKNIKNIIKINNIFKNLNYSVLQEKYGKNTEDLYPFINEEIEMNETNRFNKVITIRNILSKDVCYWIINETEKMNKWATSSYKNYSTYLNVENLPSVLNFILFVSNFWLQKIKELYEVENINTNIKDIFISKCTKDDKSTKKNKDDSFLTLNIQLNDTVDFQEGKIEFTEGEYMLQQGDMIIYGGKKERTNGSVIDGIKYVLVIMIDLF
jgi:hypothetical protein